MTMKAKGRKVMKLFKVCVIILGCALIISRWPVIPHYLANGIVWAADTITLGVGKGMALAADVGK